MTIITVNCDGAHRPPTATYHFRQLSSYVARERVPVQPFATSNAEALIGEASGRPENSLSVIGGSSLNAIRKTSQIEFHEAQNLG